MKAYGTIRFESLTCDWGCCFQDKCADKYHRKIKRNKNVRKAIRRYHRGKARAENKRLERKGAE